MASSSWIRKMFESGKELKQKLGEEYVFDFSLGNPCLEPPSKLIRAWIQHLQNSQKGKHCYTHNAGILKTRQFLAKQLTKQHLLEFDENSILLCCGAGGGLNVVFHSLLNEAQEILVSSPCFPEYHFYAKNNLGVLKLVASKQNFQLDLEAIDKSITKQTKIFLLNTPNNPTGVVYTPESIEKLSKILKKHSIKNKQTIYLVSDEPYSKIIYDNKKHIAIFKHYKDTILITSYSKNLSLAGERIGYVAIHPQITQKNLLMDALIFSNRTLGFVNAPACLQAILPEIDHLLVDCKYYCNLRDFLYKELTNIGYQIVKPQGAFYMFPKALEKDDLAFVQNALKFGILLVPGSGFGKTGHFRLSYAVERKLAKNAIGAFKKLFCYYQNR